MRDEGGSNTRIRGEVVLDLRLQWYAHSCTEHDEEYTEVDVIRASVGVGS